MHDRDSNSPTEELIVRLRRSGWSTGETAWHAISGGIVYQVDGSNGENRIRVVGAIPREAWHRAVEEAAAVGMLDEWPMPTSGPSVG
jgi:hypothetical protein